jgi:hypothetical protein
MPTITEITTLLKYAAAALVVVAFGWLWTVHNHDKSTIAGQVQLLAQASTQKNLDAATIAQLRADITAQSAVVGQLQGKAAAAMKSAEDATLAAAKASAPLTSEIARLKAKNAAPAATGKTCTDAINEWRARQ